jgi:glycosyltransferase involved in cell wall biosynthesis
MLKFEYPICVSKATRDILVQASIPVSNARIIYTGIDVDQYLNGRGFQPQTLEAYGVNLLYAGRLSADKGVDTCLRAMARLKNDQCKGVTLSVAGSGSAEYETHLREIVSQEGLDDKVTFLGQVPTESIPSLLQEFDVMLVPSTWPEPFARTVLEGMASGLAVVATPMGGTGEIVRDGENGLLFAPDDADELALKIAGLAADQALRRRLASAGQQTVREQFTVSRMMDEYESYLWERIT